MLEQYNDILKQVYDLSKECKPGDVNSKLFDFLNDQDFDTVKVVQAVMYIGRDSSGLESSLSPEEILEGQLNSLSFGKDIEIEIDQICQKTPLTNYLERAFKILKIQ